MRILLVKTSSLGDVIHNLPVATDLRRRFPDAVIDWVVEENFAELPRLHPAVRRVIPVAVRRWRKTLLSSATWSEIGAFRRAASTEFFDAVLDTQGLLKSALISTQARGPRYGHAADSAREPLAARFYDRAFSIPKNLHAVERNRRLAAAAFGYATDDLPLDYGITAPPLAAPWLPNDGKGDYAVLLTATSRADKEWPEPDWQALGQALITMGMRCVLPAGSPAERGRAGRIAATLGRAVAAPPLNLTQLAGLMAGAQIVIGVDTGLTHLAAALNRPTIAIFCASDPQLTGVFAGARAVNLGGMHAPPGAGEVLASCSQLLA
ncbi:MAG: lipopolysaccharide heptosyltransferase I [Gammaproteobacteria bacterium]|nr:lipopolysaccharide heptosyltransferase I [Gammaproteobacteria bacterium]MBU1647606.1 lipopolysaccharide heptosyltransferase I [Gammaproteobacteria bacterium]MBU1971495.1 lipopolysaccharide heptosyltransferase I [Gammaproteobacteria bacterium]